MYISAVIFVVLYAVDIALGYCIAGYIGSLFVAVALPIGIFIQLKLALFQADAIKLDDLSPSDKNKLSLAFENVLQSAEAHGYKFSKNPCIYLSEDRTMNGFNAGSAIVLNRGLMNTGCLEGVCAHEIKHWKYMDSYTSCLICNTVTVLSLLAMFVMRSVFAPRFNL